MSCPVCTGSRPDDYSEIVIKGKRVSLQGKIYAIISPDEARYAPFSDYFTVSLRTRKCGTKYLKFRTQDELNKWGFRRNDQIRCEGCLHEADGKEIVFDVTKVKFL